jgi:hypothetical protein
MTRFVILAVLYCRQEDTMKKGQMSLFATSDLGQAIMVAKDLITIACDYVAQWGDDCLYDLNTPTFVREIFSAHGLSAVQKAG